MKPKVPPVPNMKPRPDGKERPGAQKAAGKDGRMVATKDSGKARFAAAKGR